MCTDVFFSPNLLGELFYKTLANKCDYLSGQLFIIVTFFPFPIFTRPNCYNPNTTKSQVHVSVTCQ